MYEGIGILGIFPAFLPERDPSLRLMNTRQLQAGVRHTFRPCYVLIWETRSERCSFASSGRIALVYIRTVVYPSCGSFVIRRPTCDARALSVFESRGFVYNNRVRVRGHGTSPDANIWYNVDAYSNTQTDPYHVVQAMALLPVDGQCILTYPAT